MLFQANGMLEKLAVSNNNLTNYGEDLDGVIALTEAAGTHVSLLSFNFRVRTADSQTQTREH